MSTSDDRLRGAFSPDLFRRQGHELIDQLADHLAAALRGDTPVTPALEPAAMSERWPAAFPEEPAGAGALAPLVARLLGDSVHQHHPRYVGYQVTPPLPQAALTALVASLLNNGMASYEAGPAATVMERNVIRWLADRLGFPAGADGVLTSGGSAGNLTALLAARQARAGYDAWEQGAPGGPPLAILAPDESHYSVARSAQIMGLGKGGVIPVAVDDRFRLRPDALPAAFEAAERAGRRVFAVVANAGSTSTGAFDPLDAVADFCAARRLWLHVDGAHGASMTLSTKHRDLVRGIERADSVIWDAHKMMLLPALATAVLFRDGPSGAAAFTQRAHYLYSRDPADRPWDLGLRTLECTKRMMSFQLYAALALLGTRVFDDYIGRTVALARRFGELIQDAPDFELAVPPECNIVCFRHTGASGAGAAGAVEASDAAQDLIRRRVHARGGFFLTRTRLRGRVHLRTTLMNPFTHEADLAALLDAIRATQVA